MLGAALFLSLPGLAIGHPGWSSDAEPVLERPALSLDNFVPKRPLPGSDRQDVIVSGTVVDQNGDPIPGATISVPDTGVGTATDLDGRYSLSVPAIYLGFFIYRVRFPKG